MMIKRLIHLTTAILCLALAPAALGQDFDLSWWTVDGGGETFSTGGDFSLGATSGQHDAGAMSGGEFELVGGFWAVGGAGGGPPCEPCDANCDGSVDLTDVEPFILLLLGGDPCAECTGDTNNDGSVDLTDVEPFILLLLGGDPCAECTGDTTGDGSVDLTDVEGFIECLLG